METGRAANGGTGDGGELVWIGSTSPKSASCRDRRDIRDPEDRHVPRRDEAAVREKMLDKTLADSYPASDPPSSLPNPSVDSMSVAGPERLRMQPAV